MQVVVNPASGKDKRKQVKVLKELEIYLDHTLYDYKVDHSKNPLHATLLAQAAVADAFDIVVAVGGDGSINQVAKALVGTSTSLGIIPAGSGNGLAHHLRIPLNIRKAIEVLNTNYEVAIDAVVINNDYFFSIAGVGFDALIAKEFAGVGRRGFLPYLYLVLTRYLNYKPQTYHLQTDAEVITARALMVTLANSNQFGYNAKIAPQASLCDGKVDVCIIRKAPLLILPALAYKIFSGRIDTSRYVSVVKISTIEIAHDRDMYINLDGESAKTGKQISIRVKPSALKVIVPQNLKAY